MRPSECRKRNVILPLTLLAGNRRFTPENLLGGNKKLHFCTYLEASFAPTIDSHEVVFGNGDASSSPCHPTITENET
jgi:hypothetical protein